MEESRRSALKKLGLTTGAVWAAPVVTSLIVPKHAAATSNTFDGTLTLFATGRASSRLTISSTTVTAKVVSIVDVGNGTMVDGSSGAAWDFNATVAVGTTYVVNINGTAYNVEASGVIG